MSAMPSDIASKSPSGDVRVTVRMAPELAARIDTLAAPCGCGRSAFIRTCVAFADASMALEALRARQGRGQLPLEARQAQRRARRRLAEIGKELSRTLIT